MPTNPNHRIIPIYQGPKVGADADIAAEVVRALINEASRQIERGRFRVVSLTIAKDSLLIRLDLDDQQLQNEKQYLTEAKAVFGAIAADVYMKQRMGIRK